MLKDSPHDLEHLIEPLFVTGDQTSIEFCDIAEAERRFIRGHLAQGLEDATRPLPKLAPKPTREAAYRYRRAAAEQQEALAWIASDDDSFVCSFVFDCNILGLDPQAVRRAVQLARKQGIYFVRHHESMKLGYKVRSV